MRILAAAVALILSTACISTNAFLAPHRKTKSFTPSISRPSVLRYQQDSQSKFLEDAQDLMSSMKASSVAEPPKEVPTMPELGDDGIYHILNEEQHKAFLEVNQDKLVIMKFFAPWCRACKGLEPKFKAIVNDEKYRDLPIVFADLSVQHNKAFVKSLGVLALPSMHFYAGADGLVENFPCGPSKVPILKRKLVQLINDRVDPETRQLKKPTVLVECETEPCNVDAAVGGVMVSPAQMDYLRNDIPYFKDLTDEEFYELMDKAKLQTFEEGAIIMRQGMPGSTFYVIESGEVEVSVKVAFEDPLTTPSNYLGAVVNRLTKNNFFGERSCITNEDRAASIRATEKTRCFAFEQQDIPASSVLSGKRPATTERLQILNDKYGLDVYDIDFIKDQFTKANVENQKRGSVNTPEIIRGVDTDSDTEEEFESDEIVSPEVSTEDMIIPLLIRFKLIRHAARCFDYIMRTKPKWGDEGELRRRSMLVSRLTPSQKAEFTDVFNIIDSSNDGVIELLELKRVMESIGEEKTDEELKEMINKGDPSVDGNTVITYGDFMGVMAEAEFYHLFKDTFSALDQHNSGWVKASDLDRVLCGVRDLISDDRMTIIDVEDKDMMIDYEQFSKMLLGTA